MFASLSTPTRCLASGGFALKAQQLFRVTAGVAFLYVIQAFHAFTWLTTNSRARVTTIQIPVAILLTCYTVGIATARHSKRVASRTIEFLHYFLLALKLTAVIRAFPGTLVTASQLSLAFL